MRLLFDCSSLQSGPKAGGAAVYTMTILQSLLQTDAKVVLLYNSKKAFSPLYNIKELINKYHLESIDNKDREIGWITKQYKIDRLIIPVGQYISPYKLGMIECKTVIILHDIFDIENMASDITLSLYDSHLSSKKQFIKQMINHLLGRNKKSIENRYRQIIPLCCQENVELITVSQYSANTIKYHIPTLNKKSIQVCYSPAKQTIKSINIESPELQELIQSTRKYFLLVSADRLLKNAQNTIRAFEQFRIIHPEFQLVTINYPQRITEGQIVISTLSDSDLEHAYENAYALIFASFFEGFGYPPIEAMKYGTPILYSNVTSIPEIVGNAGVSFSPFYPADIYRAMLEVVEKNQYLRELSTKRYKEINLLQTKSLENIIKIMTQ